MVSVVGAAMPIVGVPVAIIGFGADSDAVAFTGFGMIVGGPVVLVVGGTIMFVGGIGAARLVDADTLPGWFGVGLLASSAVVATVNTYHGNGGTGYLAGVGLAVGGLACGVWQLHQDRIAGRSLGLLSWTVYPTSNGLAIAGRY